MYGWLLSSAMHFEPPPPNPANSPDILSTLFGSGLASLLFVLVSLALFGVIIAVAWMFVTGRWQWAKSSEATIPPASSRLQQASFVGVPPSTHQVQRQRSSYPLGQPVALSMSPHEETTPSRPDVPSLRPSLPEDSLKNKRWLGLAEECVDLFDELDDLSPQLDPPRQEIARHVKYRLQEILSRSGVESISRDRAFDEDRHQLEHPNSTVAPDTPIAEFVSPGFAVDGLVLRRARVRVAGVPSEDTKGNK